MKKFALFFLALLLTISVVAQVKVRGYYRKNGTYVQPHMRSSPDGNPYNNYSYPGNTNPYTGKVATGNPETYIKNYYNKSATYNLKNNRGESMGAYIKFGNDLNPWYFFNIFRNESTNNSIGSIGINKLTGAIILYDNRNNTTDKIIVSDNYVIDSSTPSYNNNFKSLLTEKPSDESKGVIAQESPKLTSTYNEPLFSKTYLKDKKGNYTGYYLILMEIDDTIKNYELYSSIGDLKGYITVYLNGEKFIYDVNKRLVKHIKGDM